MFVWGIVSTVIFLAAYVVGLHVFRASILKKGVYHMPKEEMEVYTHNFKLKKKCSIYLVVVILVTLLIQGIGCELIWSSHTLRSFYGTVFEDYESFIKYMEQDISSEWESGMSINDNFVVVWTDESVFYDEDGNEISEEEALTRNLEDANGNVVCTYIERNREVSYIDYTPKDGTILPIRVLTTRDYRSAVHLSEVINTMYSFLYPIELLVAVFVYLKKRVK